LEFQDGISQLVKNIHDHQQQMLTWDQTQKGFNWLNSQTWFSYFRVHFLQQIIIAFFIFLILEAI
jgi:hypothetical protein